VRAEIKSAIPLSQFREESARDSNTIYCMYVSINETSVSDTSPSISFIVNKGISEYGEIHEGLFHPQ
jgi:hypothetical protein